MPCSDIDKYLACPGAGALPFALQGHVMVSYAPPVTLDCYPLVSCNGGPGNNCSAGYQGAVCRFCSPGYRRTGSYCAPCPAAGGTWMLFLLHVAIYVAMVGLVHRASVGPGAAAADAGSVLAGFRVAMGNVLHSVRVMQLVYMYPMIDLRWTGRTPMAYDINGQATLHSSISLLQPWAENIQAVIGSVAFFPGALCVGVDAGFTRLEKGCDECGKQRKCAYTAHASAPRR